MRRSTHTPQPDVGDLPDLAPARNSQEELAAMWAMTLPERIEAIRAGRLTQRQLFAWAGASPQTVPTINGEFEFIAAHTPEIAEAPAAAAPLDPHQLTRQILEDLGKLERRWTAYHRRHATPARQLVLGE